MVTKNAVWLAALIFSVTATADDLNYETYLEELNDGQQKIDYSKALVKHDQLHLLLDQVEQERIAQKSRDKEQQKSQDAKNEGVAGAAEQHKKEPPERNHKLPDTAAGYAGPEHEDDAYMGGGVDGSEGSQEASAPALSVKPGRQGGGGYFYVAPSLRRGGNQVSNDILLARSEKNAAYFGITIGTEIKVDLKKAASNVQEGYVALSVRLDVVGQQHSLSRNGTLFARPTAVKGSERLFLRIERGITADGYEFTADGVVLGEDGKPGLAAKVTSDGKVLERALNAGEDSVAGAVVGLMAPDVASEAAKTGVGKILEDKQQADNDKSGQRAYIVLAEPQGATVQVEATF